jgi:uncharacterized protein with HEPN domain
MRPEDRIRIMHMRDACLSVTRFVPEKERANLDQDEMLCFALVRAIEIIGEAAGKVSAETRQMAPGIPWREAVDIRNRLIHADFDVDLNVLWRTATDDIPVLLQMLRALLGDGSHPLAQ